jgi:hypothetical protein
VNVRTVTAAAALAAAVAVYAVVRRDRRLHRQLRRERAASRLTEGCLHRDLAAFRLRLDAAVAQHAVADEAARRAEDVLPTPSRIHPHHPEGGPS